MCPNSIFANSIALISTLALIIMMMLMFLQDILIHVHAVYQSTLTSSIITRVCFAAVLHHLLDIKIYNSRHQTVQSRPQNCNDTPWNCCY